MVAKWPLLGDAINGAADALKFLWGYAQDVFSLLLAIVTMDFDGMGDAFGRVVERWKTMLMGFVNWVSDNIPDPIKNAIGFAGQAVSNAGSAISSGASSLISGAQAAGSAAMSAITNSTSSNQDNRVFNITGTDIGEVKRVINEKNAFAAKTIDTGVEY
jgi:phage-related protein